MTTYHWLFFLARLRALWWRWPNMPRLPEGYRGVHIGLTNGEAELMYRSHGWIPYHFHKHPEGGYSRLFIIRKSIKDLEYEKAQADSYEKCRRRANA